MIHIHIVYLFLVYGIYGTRRLSTHALEQCWETYADASLINVFLVPSATARQYAPSSQETMGDYGRSREIIRGPLETMGEHSGQVEVIDSGPGEALTVLWKTYIGLLQTSGLGKTYVKSIQTSYSEKGYVGSLHTSCSRNET